MDLSHGAKPNIFILSMTSFDRDILGSYGGKNSPMPFLDSEAKKGILFEQVFNSTSWRNIIPYLNKEVLNSTAEESGYSFLGKSFEEYHPWLREKIAKAKKVPGSWRYKILRNQNFEKEVAKYFSLFPKKPKNPLFSVLHLKENHVPYVKADTFESLPKELKAYLEETKNFEKRIPFLLALLDEGIVYKLLKRKYTPRINPRGIRQFSMKSYLEITNQELLKLWKSSKFYQKDLALLKHYYHLSMGRLDKRLKGISEKLKQLSKNRPYIILYVGAHGELFMEQDKLFHGSIVSDDAISVPAIMVSNLLKSKKRFSSQISLKSFAIYIKKLLVNLEKVENWEKYFSLLEDNDYIMAINCEADQIALRGGDYFKIVYEPHFDRYSIFDLKKDPKEKRPLDLEQDIRVKMMKVQLQEKLLSVSHQYDLIGKDFYCPMKF